MEWPSFGTDSRHTKGSSGSTSSRGSRRLKTCRKLYSRIKQSIHGANVLTLMSTRRAWNPGQKLRSKYMHRYAYTSSRGSRRLKTCRKLYSRIKQSIHGANVLTLMSTRRAWNPGQKLRSKYMHRYAYIYMYICRCVCIQADMCGYMHICRYVRTYACISDFMCSDCQFSTFGYQL